MRLKFQHPDLGSIWNFEFITVRRKKMEAAIGFEPMNEGFADLCLSHLATPPRVCYALKKDEEKSRELGDVR